TQLGKPTQLNFDLAAQTVSTTKHIHSVWCANETERLSAVPVDGLMSMITALSSVTPELTATLELTVLRESVEASYKARTQGRSLPHLAVNDLGGACEASLTAFQRPGQADGLVQKGEVPVQMNPTSRSGSVIRA